MEYSVPTKNRFLVPLSDDEDLIEYSHRQEEEKTKKKAESDKLKKDKSSQKSTKGKANKKINVVQQADQKSKQGDNVNTKKDVENRLPRSANQTKQSGDREKPERNVKFSKEAREGDDRRQDRQERRFNRDVEKSSTFSDFREKPERSEGDERRGRGRGRGFGRGRGGRGRGGSEGGFDRNQRTYDRRSGSDKTGVKQMDKRDGGGSRNWGTVKEDLQGQLNDSNASEENIDWNATNDDNENKDPNEVPAEGTTEPVEGGEGETEPKEEEAREMTLDEWKQEQKKQRAKPVYNIRKANEGADSGQWTKYHVLDSKKKKTDDDSDEEEEDDDEYEYTHGRKQQVTNLIQVVIADPYGRGGGGGRGRGRGGRGRGGPGRGRGGERGGGGGGRGGDRDRGDRDRDRGERFGGRGGSKRDLPPAPDVNDKDSFPGLGDS